MRGSVGLPYQGVLTEPVALPLKGEGYVHIKEPGKNYGTRVLVQTIVYAAAQVHRQRPGSELHVGDLSAVHGGQIPNHASHRSGRDADLVYYATDLGGAPIPSPDWTIYGPDGIGLVHQGGGGRVWAQFDIERNWLLVKALMQAPDAGIMWIFVSNPLRALLAEYAFARGEEPELVWQAQNVMHQPKNALPHDDHFHIRIACPRDDVMQGCEQGGPTWPWLPPQPALAWPKEPDAVAELLGVATIDPLEP
jgi:penicillin-insensitive murein endopeptidase